MTSDNGKMEASRSNAGTPILVFRVDYLPKSPNKTIGLHWSSRKSEQAKARQALWNALGSSGYALFEFRGGNLTTTISPEALKGCATKSQPPSNVTIPRNPLSGITGKSKAAGDQDV